MEITRRDCLKGLVAGAAASGLGGAVAAAPAGGQAAPGPERIVRFERGGAAAYGVLDGERVKELRGVPFESLAEAGRGFALGEVKLLPPAAPSKILAMAGNYRSHVAGAQNVPKKPEAFYKPPSALVENGGAIVIPPGTSDVHYEGELVLVIGKQTKNVSREEARRCVFGLTCGNDVSARDWQKGDTQWWRAKGSDTFAALGPWIVHGLDPSDLLLTTRLNGKEVQRARTSELIFDVPELVSFLSRHLTLLPGDLIYTGTPGTTGPMKPGDVVEVEIEKIGVLKNRVA